jgi:hypothetical protein
VPRGAGLQGVELQLLEGLDDRDEASGGRRLNGCDSPHQLTLRGDDKIQTPEAHVHTRGPVDSVAGHPKPDEDDETRKGPYLACQLSVFRITG